MIDDMLAHLHPLLHWCLCHDWYNCPAWHHRGGLQWHGHHGCGIRHLNHHRQQGHSIQPPPNCRRRYRLQTIALCLTSLGSPVDAVDYLTWHGQFVPRWRLRMGWIEALTALMNVGRFHGNGSCGIQQHHIVMGLTRLHVFQKVDLTVLLIFDLGAVMIPCRLMVVDTPIVHWGWVEQELTWVHSFNHHLGC